MNKTPTIWAAKGKNKIKVNYCFWTKQKPEDDECLAKRKKKKKSERQLPYWRTTDLCSDHIELSQYQIGCCTVHSPALLNQKNININKIFIKKNIIICFFLLEKVDESLRPRHCLGPTGTQEQSTLRTP